jgi:hypothetical protein
MASKPATRKPPRRTVGLVRSPAADGVAVVHFAVGKDEGFYAVYEVPCEIGGRGFAVHRLGLGTLYHVRVGAPEDTSCECKGFLRHGHCKHTRGLLALIEVGKL